MFSALKKFVSADNQDGSKIDVPDGMHTMGQSLQRKFAKGVQYNMKVIIKGDRNTGKSTLFRRLQGEKFREEYIPTPEIQVASIQWGYKATDDIVKVEVWDVVDKGKAKKYTESLKLGNESVEADDQPCLDASFLDVYKGTHGVVMMLDITKLWTWQYVERELPSVPNHIPVLVMGNMRDMGPHRTVDQEDSRFYIEHFQRPEGSAPVMYAESSMKNGFGLRYLHTFFNIPYLQLQKEALLTQLETNKMESKATIEELQLRKESEDQNYDLYLGSLESKRNQRKKKAPPQSPQMQSLPLPNGKTQQSVTSSSSSSTPAKVSPAATPPTTQREIPVAQAAEPSTTSTATPVPPRETDQQSQSLSQKFSRWFGSSETKIEQGRKEDGRSAVIEPPAEIVNKPHNNTTISSVDDFVPEEDIDRSFFEDEPAPKSNKKNKKGKKEDPVIQRAPEPEMSSESDIGENPMVAGFQEELDSDDEGPEEIPAKSPEDSRKKLSSREVQLSSDSEPEGPVVQADEDLDSSDGDRNDGSSEVNNKVETPQGDLSLNQQKHSKKDKPVLSAKSNLKIDVSDGIVAKTATLSSSSEPESATSPSSAGIQLQLEDLNFLESVTSKSSKLSSSKKHISQPNYEFDSLVSINDDGPSGTETSTTTTSTSSSAKKKKSRTKDRDEEKSHRKHRHKKHKEKASKEEQDDKTGKKKKKRTKKKEDAEPADKQEMDALEMFLEGNDSVGYEAI